MRLSVSENRLNMNGVKRVYTWFAGSSPVTKGILASTLVASALLHARDLDGNFNVTLGEFSHEYSPPTACVSCEGGKEREREGAVSYTHLTLPTKA